jgi:hypothetical protein
MAFSFQNISGFLGPSPAFDGDKRLATAIGMAYVRFVYALDPNLVSGANESGGGALQLLFWLKYGVGNLVNMVLNASGPFVESGTFRREGIEFLKTFDVARELLA